MFTLPIVIHFSEFEPIHQRVSLTMTLSFHNISVYRLYNAGHVKETSLGRCLPLGMTMKLYRTCLVHLSGTVPSHHSSTGSLWASVASDARVQIHREFIMRMERKTHDFSRGMNRAL